MHLESAYNKMAFLFAVLGLVLTFAWAPTLAGGLGGLRKDPVFAEGLDDPRLELEGVSAESLARDEAVKARRKLSSRLKPDAELLPWRGLWVTKSPKSNTDLQDEFLDARQFADGPPFHLIVGPGDEIVATSRWRRQLDWPVAGLAASEPWIGVVLVPGVSDSLVSRLKQILLAPNWSQGGLALRANLSSAAQIMESPR